MPTEFTSIPDDFSTPVNPDSIPFAPMPAWERGKTRRSLAGGDAVAAEPRTFSAEPITTRPVTRPTTLTDDARAYEARGHEARMDRVDPAETAFAAEPVYATRTAVRKTSAAPIAIMAGLILLGGVAAAGWYYSQPRDAGVAQLTPGSTITTTEVASNAVATDASVAPPTAAAAPVTPTTTTTTTTKVAAPVRTTSARTTVTRSRHAPAAADNAADVSVRAPVQAAPAPAAPPAAAAPAPLVLTLPAQPIPTQTAPAPETPPTR